LMKRTGLSCHDELMMHYVLTLPDADALFEGIRTYSGIKGSPDTRMAARIIDAASTVPDSLDIRTIVRCEPVTFINQNAVNGENISIQSEKISLMVSLMSGPVTLYVYALTLGERFDNLSMSRMETSITEAFLIDAAGSFIAEHCADQLERQIAEELKDKGFAVSSRFSPGYCDWDIQKGQEAIAGFLELRQIGVKILPSSIMMPGKTITGVLLSAEIIPEKTPCPLCSNNKCTYRRYDSQALNKRTR